MSLNLEKDKIKNNIDWNFIVFCIVLCLVGIAAIIVNSPNCTKSKDISSVGSDRSYLRIQECKKIEQDKWHCNLSIVSKME